MLQHGPWWTCPSTGLCIQRGSSTGPATTDNPATIKVAQNTTAAACKGDASSAVACRRRACSVDQRGHRRPHFLDTSRYNVPGSAVACRRRACSVDRCSMQDPPLPQENDQSGYASVGIDKCQRTRGSSRKANAPGETNANTSTSPRGLDLPQTGQMD